MREAGGGRREGGKGAMDRSADTSSAVTPPSSPLPPPAIRMDGIDKSFGAIRANRGASLEVMDRDARKMRGERPFVFTCLKEGTGLDTVVGFIERQGLMRA